MLNIMNDIIVKIKRLTDTFQLELTEITTSPHRERLFHIIIINII